MMSPAFVLSVDRDSFSVFSRSTLVETVLGIGETMIAG